MKVRQYPHYLFAVIGGDSVQDENGNWTDPEETSLLFISMCREETDGRGIEIRAGDGTYHKVTSVIQMPKSSKGAKEGTSILVTNDDAGTDIRLKGVVLKFDKAQLHSRIWL